MGHRGMGALRQAMRDNASTGRCQVKWQGGHTSVVRTAALVCLLTAAVAVTPTPSPSPLSVAACKITTYVGDGTASSAGDGGSFSAASINGPRDVLRLSDRTLILEEAGARVRSVNRTTGVITTILGNGGTTGSFLGVSPLSANVGTLSQMCIAGNGHLVVTAFARCTAVGWDMSASSTTYAFAGNGTCRSPASSPM
jgi:hypothetical protein